MCLIAALAAGGHRMPAGWLLVVFLLLACGEVVIAPCALSTAADVVGPDYRGRTIGLTWLFSALGAGVGSQLVHLATALGEPAYYGVLGGAACLVGLAVAGRAGSLQERLDAKERHDG